MPPYEHVANALRDEIAEGTLAGQLPSVHTISEHHDDFAVTPDPISTIIGLWTPSPRGQSI